MTSLKKRASEADTPQAKRMGSSLSNSYNSLASRLTHLLDPTSARNQAEREKAADSLANLVCYVEFVHTPQVVEDVTTCANPLLDRYVEAEKKEMDHAVAAAELALEEARATVGAMKVARARLDVFNEQRARNTRAAKAVRLLQLTDVNIGPLRSPEATVAAKPKVLRMLQEATEAWSAIESPRVAVESWVPQAPEPREKASEDTGSGLEW